MAYMSQQAMSVRPYALRRLYQDDPISNIRSQYGLATQLVKEKKAQQQAEQIRQENMRFQQKQFQQAERQFGQQQAFQKHQAKGAMGMQVAGLASKFSGKQLGNIKGVGGLATKAGVGKLDIGNVGAGAGIGYGLATAFGAKKSWQRAAGGVAGAILGGLFG